MVFFTSTDQEQRLKAFVSGATDCLTKPFLKEEMVARLLVHLEKVQLHRRLQHSVSELRSAEPQHPPEERGNLEMIQQSGQLLLALIDDVLTLARQESSQSQLDLQPVSLGDLVRRSVANLRHLAVGSRSRSVPTVSAKSSSPSRITAWA